MKTLKISTALLVAITLATISHAQADTSLVALNNPYQVLNSPSATETRAQEVPEKADDSKLYKKILRQEFFERMADIGPRSLK